MAQNIINGFINDTSIPYIIFGRAYCKYCNMAKDLFKKNNIKFIYIDLDLKDPDDEYINIIKKESNMNTIPIIYKNKNNNYDLIGGYTELLKIL